MAHCTDKTCKKKSCDGNCKDVFTTRLRQQDLEDCDGWRCCCGSECAPKSGACGSCGTSREAGECAKFGVNFNAQRKRSTISPKTSARIQSLYGGETITLPTVVWDALPGQPPLVVGQLGYFYIALGDLGLSHDVCVHSITGLFSAEVVPLPVTAVRWGVAGVRIVCDGGAWVQVIDTPTLNTPLPLQPSSLVAVCPPPCPPPPCACTPAEGAEIFVVQAVVPAGDPNLVGAIISVTRCDWLKECECTIGTSDGRQRLPEPIPSRIVLPLPLFG